MTAQQIFKQVVSVLESRFSNHLARCQICQRAHNDGGLCILGRALSSTLDHARAQHEAITNAAGATTYPRAADPRN